MEVTMFGVFLSNEAILGWLGFILILSIICFLLGYAVGNSDQQYRKEID